MPVEIGNISKFIVKRETDISYTLSPLDPDLTTYVFLHFNQATRKLEIDEVIDAFLYYDQKKRLCATMEQPIITTTKTDFVKVVGINRAGVFVDIGIAKDILLSSDYLPGNEKAWPEIGDMLPCTLRLKTDTLVAKLITRTDHVTTKLAVGDSYDGVVVRISPEGVCACCSDYNTVFIHRSLTRKLYHIGEKINFKVISINDKGEYNGSTIERKEIARLDDSDIILNYLKTMGGVLNLGNASTPDEINRYFKMSKGAFKRAVGALYKQRLISIEDYKIKLLDN